MKTRLIVAVGYLGTLTSAANLATLSMTLLSKALKFIGIGLVVAAVSAIAMQFEFLNGSIKKAAESAGVMSEKMGALKNSISSYRVRIKEAGDSVTAVTEINKELRAELVKIASNSKEFGFELSNAAFKAMNSISSLTGEVEEGSTAIDEYREAVLRLESVKLADYFKKQQESINQNSRDMWGKWATNAGNSLSYLGKMFVETEDTVSMKK